MFKKIVNSGDYGIEQGALAAGFMRDWIYTGGYIRKDFETSNGKKEDLKFLGLEPMETNNQADVLKNNIDSSHGTMLFVKDQQALTTQEAYIYEYCNEAQKHLLLINVDKPINDRVALKFIKDNDLNILHVTGTADLKDKKRYFRFAKRYFEKIIDTLKHEYMFEGKIKLEGDDLFL